MGPLYFVSTLFSDNQIYMNIILEKKDNFMESLAHRVLVCDGAIGTELRKRVPTYLQCVDACNLSTEYAEEIKAIHRAYCDAGADIIQTNTYQANREALAVHGLAEQVKEINRTGVQLARTAVQKTRYIAGSVGQIPFQTLDVPVTKVIRGFFKEQMDALVDEGVDLLVLETFVSFKQAQIATKQALTYGLPVIVEISGVSGGTVGTGLDVRVFAQELEQLGTHESVSIVEVRMTWWKLWSSSHLSSKLRLLCNLMQGIRG